MLSILADGSRNLEERLNHIQLLPSVRDALSGKDTLLGMVLSGRERMLRNTPLKAFRPLLIPTSYTVPAAVLSPTKSDELIRTALIRAFMCEKLARESGRHDCAAEAYSTGMLSSPAPARNIP